MVSRAPALLLLGAAMCMLLTPPTVGAQPESIASDDRGFIGTDVRCEVPQSAVAFGRTAQSLVAICVNPDGHYEYRGARLGDDAVLIVVAEPTVPGEFFAQKDGATYTVTAKELVIRSDEWVRIEPVLQFGTPPLLAVEVPASKPGQPVSPAIR